MLRYHSCYTRQLVRGNLACQQRDNVASTALGLNPEVVAFPGFRRDAKLHAVVLHVVCYLRTHSCRITVLWHFHQHAHGKSGVYHGLANIQYIDGMPGQNSGNPGCEAWLVFT